MTSAAEGQTLYLIDGTAQVFRAYFAIRGLSNEEGLPTNAVFGFTTMMRKLLRDERPSHVAAAFDLSGDVFRHETYAEYKANRPPAPEDLNVQMPYAKEACEALGVKVLEQEGYEADDLIATYTRMALEAGVSVVVVSSDKDLLQLVGEDVIVLNPSKDLRLDAAGVAESFGVPPQRVRDVLGLMGDSVDNIPGVPGVGEKTAISVISIYGDLERVIDRAARFATLYDARDELVDAIDHYIKGLAPLERLIEAERAFATALGDLCGVEADDQMLERLREVKTTLDEVDLRAGPAADRKERSRRSRILKKALKSMDKGSAKRIWYAIHENVEQARMSRELATLHEEVPVELEIEQLCYRVPEPKRAHTLFESLGFGRLSREFADEAASAAEADKDRTATPGASGSDPSEEVRYEAVLGAERLDEIVDALRRAGRFAVDTETDHVDPLRARLVGISLAWEEGKGVYVPLGHDYDGAPEQLALAEVQKRLGPLLADPEFPKFAQNLIYDAHVLGRHGLPVVGWDLDTMVAAFLLDSGRSSYSMDSLAEEYLGYTTIKYSEVAGKGAKQVTLNLVDVDRVTEYAAEDADVTLRLAGQLAPRLDAAGLRELYDRIDGPLLPVLVEMEANGIRVDTGLLQEMSAEMEGALETARGEIHSLAGVEFNVDSPKQLREVLFDGLGLKPGRRTAKSGVASTDAQTLEELAGEHAIAGRILEYRELAKLKGTYVDALPKLVHPETGRVHTSYHPTGAATGRLSSSDPNLQNIPARTEAGRRIRSAFVPEEGYRFLASDYSQVELRVLAHMAEDEELTEAFRAGEDIHRFTASRVFGVSDEEVTTTMRRRAKAVNFGILYGMSETRLAREQGIPRGEARGFIRAYFERFSSVRAYIDRVREQALQEAAVRTLFGRVRFFPQLHQRVNRAVQEQALRAAVNTTIQGTAADLMKLAMLRVDRELKRQGLSARVLLQVHDELLLEVPINLVSRVRTLVREAMEGVHRLAVPLVVDQKDGESWLEVT
jgi:DNA polymerase-1